MSLFAKVLPSPFPHAEAGNVDRDNEHDASHRDFDFLRLDSPLNRHGTLVVEHHSVGIADILFELFERGALAEHARHLWQAAYEPLPVFPVLKAEAEGT